MSDATTPTAPAGWEYLGGPRDGETTDSAPGFTDLLSLGSPGTYVMDAGRTIDRRGPVSRDRDDDLTVVGPPRRVVVWRPRAGGRRNPPPCPHRCSPGCPTGGLTAA